MCSYTWRQPHDCCTIHITFFFLTMFLVSLGRDLVPALNSQQKCLVRKQLFFKVPTFLRWENTFAALRLTFTWQGALGERSVTPESPFELRHTEKDISQLHPQEVSTPGAGGPRALQHRLDSRGMRRRSKINPGAHLLRSFILYRHSLEYACLISEGPYYF